MSGKHWHVFFPAPWPHVCFWISRVSLMSGFANPEESHTKLMRVVHNVGGFTAECGCNTGVVHDAQEGVAPVSGFLEPTSWEIWEWTRTNNEKWCRNCISVIWGISGIAFWHIFWQGGTRLMDTNQQLTLQQKLRGITLMFGTRRRAPWWVGRVTDELELQMVQDGPGSTLVSGSLKCKHSAALLMKHDLVTWQDRLRHSDAALAPLHSFRASTVTSRDCRAMTKNAKNVCFSDLKTFEVTETV